jgi:hypothetical protein
MTVSSSCLEWAKDFAESAVQKATFVMLKALLVHLICP